MSGVKPGIHPDKVWRTPYSLKGQGVLCFAGVAPDAHPACFTCCQPRRQRWCFVGCLAGCQPCCFVRWARGWQPWCEANSNHSATRSPPGSTTAKDTATTTTGSCVRSHRAATGDEAKHRERGFAARHHLPTVVEVKAGPQNRSGKKRRKAAMNLPLFVAFGHWQLSPLVAL